MKTIACLFVLLSSPLAFAYPEMIRHGYVNCTTCHISPNGGGVLTDYGRGLSQEVLSTWGREGEGALIYGLVDSVKPEALHVNGELRAVQFIQKNPSSTSSRFIFMQADLEAAWTHRWITVAASAGAYDGSFQSRNHYVLLRSPWEDYQQVILRLGKFSRAYGLNLPDHTLGTRNGVGFDEGTQTYNFEANWIDEWFSLSLTGILGRPDNADLNREAGFSARSAVSFLDTYQTGLSYYFGGANGDTRSLVGPFFSLGFTPHFFLLSELAVEFKDSRFFGARKGLYEIFRLQYEFIQGVHVYFLQQFAKSDLSTSSTQSESYGGGLQLFPRPHFEVVAEWLKVRAQSSFSNAFRDRVTLLFHVYL